MANSVSLGVFAPMSISWAPRLDVPRTPPRLPSAPWVFLVGAAAMVVLNVLLKNGVALG